MPSRYSKCCGALAAAAVFALCSLAGCGGGGGGSTAGRAATLGVYVTDAFSDSYSQVWVTLYKIEASTDGTTWVTLYNNATGSQLNLSSLATTEQFLNSISVPAGSYTRVRVTFGNQVSLVPAGGGAATTVTVDPSVGTQSGGMVAITLAATTAVASGELSNLVVDFNLASFQLVGGHIRPAVQQGDDNGLHQKKCHGAVEGVVQNLQAGVSFSLLKGDGGRVITVDLASSTQVFNQADGSAGTLANGQTVEVAGTVDPQTHTVTATTIKIEPAPSGTVDGGSDEHTRAQAKGTIASLDGQGGFVVTLSAAENFTPSGGTVSVTTSASTHFLAPGKHDAAYTDLTQNSPVVVVGTYDPASGAIAARVVVMLPANDAD